jgi:anti-sigma factor RsiW
MSTLSELQREQLSAYIDGMLPEAERGQLELLLQSDAELAAELRELQTTAALLRDLPPVRPPRSFTLDPATVAPRRRSFGFAWTRWAALVGALALFLTVGLSVLNTGSSSPTTGSLAMAPSGSAGDASAAATVAPAAEAPPEAADSAGGAMPPGPMAAESQSAPSEPPLAAGGAADQTPVTASANNMTTTGGTLEGLPAGGAPAGDLSRTTALAPGATYPFSSSLAGGEQASPQTKSSVTETFDRMQIDPAAGMVLPTLEDTDTSSPDTRDVVSAPFVINDNPMQTAPADSADEYPNLGLLFGLLALAGVVGALALSLASRRLDRRD